MPEEDLSVEMLEMRTINPALADSFSRKTMVVLEQQKRNDKDSHSLFSSALLWATMILHFYPHRRKKPSDSIVTIHSQSKLIW